MKEEIKVWLKRVDSIKKNQLDLSKNEDLSIALMNLISLEEHFYFSAMKTNDKKYLSMLSAVRELRKKLLARIVKKNDYSEKWCISKHLLGASMRLIEVGTKEMSEGNKKEANFLFKSAFNLWSLFFGINLDLVKSGEIDEIAVKETKTFTGRLSQIIKKLVDCCKE